MVKPPQRVRSSDLPLRSALWRTSRRVSIPVPGRDGSWFPCVRPSRSDHQSVFPCTLRFPVREFPPTELFSCVGRAPSPAFLVAYGALRHSLFLNHKLVIPLQTCHPERSSF